MKNTILFILAVCCLKLSATAQFCNSETGLCYKEDAYFLDSQIQTKEYKYATVQNIYRSSTASVNLYMTVYSPCRLPDLLNNLDKNIPACLGCKRPFILMIHGGGFRGGCRTNSKDDCMEFAKRGYVVATIDYRLGWVPGDEKQNCYGNFCYQNSCPPQKNDSCKSEYKDSTNFAMYRAFQDAAAAMRFIVHYAASLNVDTNYLYLTGYSAGAIIANAIAFLSQTEINKVMPNARPILGVINRYGNNFTESYKIAGLFNNWGGLYDTNYIKGLEDRIPMIAFHGIDDAVIPFNKGAYYNCTNAAYGYTYGSNCMYKRLIHSYPGLPVELYACYGGHGIFEGDPKKDPKSLYRIQKAVCFFYRLRMKDQSQKYISINQNEKDITYEELDSISPVSCIKGGLHNNTMLYTNAVSSNTAVSNERKPVEFNVYPNPARDQAILSIKGEVKRITITLARPDGSTLWRRTNVEENVISLPLKDLSSGLYFIIIKNDNYTKVLKLIKQEK